MLMATQLIGFGVGGVSLPLASYVGFTQDASDNSSYSFAGVSIGSPAADRVVVVAVHYSNGRTLSSATIGGVSASVVSGQNVSIISALVPTGTTATIAITLTPGASTQCCIGVWAVTGLLSATATDSYTGFTGSTTAVDILANGIVIAAGTHGSATALSFSGQMTERYDSALESREVHGGDYTAGAAEIGPTFTTTATDGFAVAAFR